MTQPDRPPEPPAEGAKPGADPHGDTPHGIPKGMEDHDAAGTPNNDRQGSETAVTKSHANRS